MIDERAPFQAGGLPLGRGRSKLLWAQLLPHGPILQAGLSASSYAAEQYRQLAVLAGQIRGSVGRADQVVAVTSSEPASGKTLTSLNLALALARKGETRVVLLECDLWKPRLETYLRVLPDTPGIFQVLTGQARLEDALLSVWGGGLDVIRAGVKGEVENRFADRKMTEILTRLRSRYEFVILDTPPLLLASGRSLARLAQRVLVVVRAGRTRKKGMEEALSALDRDRVMGFVLNDVPEKRLKASTYSYYGPYGYASRDGEDDKQDEEPRVDLPLSYPDPDGEEPQRGRGRRRWRRPTSIGALLGLGALLTFLWLGGEGSPVPKRLEGRAAVETGAVLPDRVASTPAVAADGQPSPPAMTGETTVEVRLRSGPGEGFSTLTVVPEGEPLEILGEGGDPPGSWVRVRLDEGEGWVFAAYVETPPGATAG